MKISLADRLGNVKKVRVGFSFVHFFTGPLYCCFRLKFFTALFECLYLFYLLPIPGMNEVVALIRKMTFIPAEFSITPKGFFCSSVWEEAITISSSAFSSA